LREGIVGFGYEKIRDFANRKVVDGGPPAYEFGDEPFRKRHAAHFIRRADKTPRRSI
jgi:hypothetical protein